MPEKPIKPTVQQAAIRPPEGPRPPGGIRPPEIPSARRPTVNQRLDQVTPSGGMPMIDDGERAVPFRPIGRPPMAFLTILDDGSEEGEVRRLRGNQTIIGRANGEIVIPHDLQMSSTHAMIERRQVDGAYQWFLKDLDSTNGTFARVMKVTLRDGLVLILGSYRYVYQSAPTAPPAPADGQVGATRGWAAVRSVEQAQAPATLTRLLPDGTERVFPIQEDVVVIGQDIGSCGIVLGDDPAISTAHARIQRNEAGEAVLEDLKSLNGTWMAVRESRLAKNSFFQLGEQRFRFRTAT